MSDKTDIAIATEAIGRIIIDADDEACEAAVRYAGKFYAQGMTTEEVMATGIRVIMGAAITAAGQQEAEPDARLRRWSAKGLPAGGGG